MKLKIITITLLAWLSYGFIHCQDNFYSIDASHSILSFKARHVGFGAVIGKFGAYEGAIYYKSPKDISASVSLYVNSLSTDNTGRDGILKEKFFQHKKYPTINFSSEAIESQNGSLKMIGILTIGGISREVVIPFDIVSEPTKDQFGHERIALSGGLTIDRKDFDLFYRGNSFWDSIVSDDIEINLEISAYSYNSLETIFPFRDNSIGKILFEKYRDGRKKAVSDFFNNQYRNDSINTSHSSNLRGALHTAQSGDLEGAISILQISIDNREDLTDVIKAEYLAQIAKYYFLSNMNSESVTVAKQALQLDASNTLAMELKKRINTP